MRTGTARLPLHGGDAPRWLFTRMVKLAREIGRFVVEEHGPEELLRRMADPFWFQALGCVLGFDWHSSGVTTTTCGALKEGLRPLGRELGVFVCGGKGRTSRKTPDEIARSCEMTGQDAGELVYASRMSAKVDNSALQDGYQLYHHCFAFTRSGLWCVVQQGMNGEDRTARRYHWLSEGVSDFVCEPHLAICCDARGEGLNLVAREGEANRSGIAQLAAQQPAMVRREVERVRSLCLPRRHAVTLEDVNPARLERTLLSTYECAVKDFAEVLGRRGVGAKTLRALSLVAEVIYGAPPSFRDPARFSYAHGGKDGTPFPVDRLTYDRTIETLRLAVNAAKAGACEKARAMRRLAGFERRVAPNGPRG